MVGGAGGTAIDHDPRQPERRGIVGDRVAHHGGFPESVPHLEIDGMIPLHVRQPVRYGTIDDIKPPGPREIRGLANHVARDLPGRRVSAGYGRIARLRGLDSERHENRRGDQRVDPRHVRHPQGRLEPLHEIKGVIHVLPALRGLEPGGVSLGPLDEAVHHVHVYHKLSVIHSVCKTVHAIVRGGGPGLDIQQQRGLEPLEIIESRHLHRDDKVITLDPLRDRRVSLEIQVLVYLAVVGEPYLVGTGGPVGGVYVLKHLPDVVPVPVIHADRPARTVAAEASPMRGKAEHAVAGGPRQYASQVLHGRVVHEVPRGLHLLDILDHQYVKVGPGPPLAADGLDIVADKGRRRVVLVTVRRAGHDGPANAVRLHVVVHLDHAPGDGSRVRPVPYRLVHVVDHPLAIEVLYGLELVETQVRVGRPGAPLQRVVAVLLLGA